jgi:hypothetical protein
MKDEFVWYCPLIQLTQRTSGKGNAYLTVGPGKAELVIHGKELP